MIQEGRMILNIGPQHPSTHGVLRMQVELEGERVINVTPVIGYLHRGFEKIAENRNYMQVIPLTDRLDYLASMANNMVYVRAVEELLGVQIPERAEYIRVIVLELQRLASHLAAVGFYGNDLGLSFTAMMYTFRERELILDLFESICGARLTYNYLRFGGVREDLPDNFKEKAREVLAQIKPKIDEYERFLSEDEIFLMRTKGIGILKPEDAINMGAAGPVLRGSGVKTDTRVTDPYTIYDKFDWEVVTGKDGDCFSRYIVWINEMRQSIRIVEQALDALPEGHYLTKVPRLLKPPAGEVYSRIESPRGELCMHLVSDGATTNPYRLKIRSPAFCNLSLLPHLAKNVLIADLIAITGSLDPVFGEIDR
jgi:NADH-quinone oxidoreductase subunit D